VAVGEAQAQPRAAPTLFMAARHVGGRPGLVDEDQPFWVEIGLGVEPCSPLLQDVRTVLFDRVAGLFFRVIPRAASRSQSSTNV
jgi:hypothetical protein